uniref:Uncharacterized protein n=1 Tax=OCS116 cluster bacterium TaxID=2030921 RepID=A0A2A4YS99_9PROT
MYFVKYKYGNNLINQNNLSPRQIKSAEIPKTTYRSKKIKINYTIVWLYSLPAANCPITLINFIFIQI